jgi:hypothetical protein
MLYKTSCLYKREREFSNTARWSYSTFQPYLHLSFELYFLLLSHFQILLQLLNLHVTDNLYMKENDNISIIHLPLCVYSPPPLPPSLFCFKPFIFLSVHKNFYLPRMPSQNQSNIINTGNSELTSIINNSQILK